MSLLRPYMRRSYVHWGEQGYVDYFRKPIYQSGWFGFVTFFFMMTFGHGLWVLSRHWTENPTNLKYVLLTAAVAMMPLPWLRAIGQHSSLRGMVSRGLGLEDAVEKRLLKETAYSSLFMLGQAYVTMNLILGVIV